MTNREDVVAAVVSAAGKELTSRIRLQKSVYLLDRLGLNSGFDFDYHHYGPYSRDLDNAAEDAKAFDLIKEEFAYRVRDGARYSVFRLTSDVQPKAQAYGELGKDKAVEFAKLFARTNVTILELSATIDWLWREEKVSDWRTEVRKRKTVKTESGRLDRAVDLLQELGLPPPEVSAKTAQ